jgi:MFS family permease
MSHPDIMDEFTRMTPIDSEIASLANSLRPDIRVSGKSTPTALDLEKVTTVTWAPVPSPETPRHKFLVLFSVYMSFVVSVTPVLFITSSLRITHRIAISLTAAYIIADIGGETTYPWLGIAYSISAAAVSPAVGAISDFLARRHLLLTGNALVLAGMVIVGSAGEMSIAIGGMAVAGVGAALAGVVAVAAVCEIVRVQDRGKYIATGFILLLPFSAIPTYGTLSFSSRTDAAQLYSASATWRWGAWISIILVCLTFTLTGVFYQPPLRPGSQGLGVRNLLFKIDFFGVVLLTGGIALFLVGLQWGGMN